MAHPVISSGGVVFRPDPRFNGLKVFSATMFEQRARLGEDVTTWIDAHPHLAITEIAVTQSSDANFHCIAITVFYWERITR